MTAPVTVLRRRTGATLWQQIGEILARDIASGSYRTGQLLPAEPALMERFGVSRSTVRRAVAELEAQGLVRVEQGRGTFVHEDGRINYPISERTRFSQALIAAGFEPSAETLSEEQILAADHVAAALRLAPGESVYHLVRLSSADGRPVSVGDVYYPVRRFPDLPAKRRTRSAVTPVYAEYGMDDYVRLQTFITARLPTPQEARTLNQPQSRPVIVVRKLDADMAGVPIAYGETIWAAERVEFSIDMTALNSSSGG